MGDGDGEHVALAHEGRERSGNALHDQVLRLAAELQAGVAHERAGEQAGLAEHLEAVAAADDRATRSGEVGEGAHHGGEACDSSGAEVVAVGEAAGDDEAVEPGDVRLLVEDVLRLRAEDALDRVAPVGVRPGAGEDDDTVGSGHHAPCPSSSPTMRLTALPSARPLSWGMSLPITLPLSPGPDAPTSATTCSASARISSSPICSGR